MMILKPLRFRCMLALVLLWAVVPAWAALTISSEPIMQQLGKTDTLKVWFKVTARSTTNGTLSVHGRYQIVCESPITGAPYAERSGQLYSSYSNFELTLKVPEIQPKNYFMPGFNNLNPNACRSCTMHSFSSAWLGDSGVPISDNQTTQTKMCKDNTCTI